MRNCNIYGKKKGKKKMGECGITEAQGMGLVFFPLGDGEVAQV